MPSTIATAVVSAAASGAAAWATGTLASFSFLQSFAVSMVLGGVSKTLPARPPQ